MQQAMQKAGVQPAAVARAQARGLRKHRSTRIALQALWARLVTAPGTYEQPMLLDQLNSIAGAEGGADQKVGAESRRRFDDLVKEMKAIDGELQRASGM